MCHSSWLVSALLPEGVWAEYNIPCLIVHQPTPQMGCQHLNLFLWGVIVL